MTFAELFNATDSEFIHKVFTNTSLGYRLLHRLDLANLRHIFYLISPYETTFYSLDDVPNYNVQVSAWWLMLIFLEYVVLTLQGNDDRFALNDSLTSIFAGMFSQMFKFGGRTVAIFGYVFIWNNFRILELSWESPWTWIFCLVFQDFAYYLGHRAVHEAGFFWGLHTIHHSSEYYNLSTALRQAAIQDVGLAFYDILQAFFIPPPIFLVHRYFSEIFQFWLHTSLLGSLGPLGIVFNTPSYHRVHHGRNPYCIDRNYGGVFIIWDKMFHTFEKERPEDPPIYGLVTNEKTFNQLWLQFHTLKELLFDKWRSKDEKGNQIFVGPKEKLKAIFFPPGYFPGTKVVTFFHWFSMADPKEGVPEVDKNEPKYNPQLSKWIKAYTLSHFLLLLTIFMHFEYDRNQLDYVDFTLKVAFVVCTAQSFGAFFDVSWYAPYMEIFRCSGVIAYYLWHSIDGAGLHLKPNRIFMLIVFGSSAVVWIAYSLRQLLAPKSVKPTDHSDNPDSAKEVHALPAISTSVVVDYRERRAQA